MKHELNTGARLTNTFHALALTSLLLTNGCAGTKPHPKQSELHTPLQQFLDTSMLTATGREKAYDLAYCTAAFFRRERRWPKDYAELRDFVDHSNGFLVLDAYQGTTFMPKPPDRVEISYGSNGITNRMTLEPPNQKSQ